MSLVAYASSEEEEEGGEGESDAAAEADEEDDRVAASEDEDQEAAIGAGEVGSRGSFFSVLPPPKGSAASLLLLPPPRASFAPAPLSEEAPAAPGKRRRTQPVRITAPRLRSEDSEEEEEADTRAGKQPCPWRRQQQQQQGNGGGSGLSALLPQPGRPPAGKEPAAPLGHPKPAAAMTPSPSALKAAAKSAALQVTRQMAQEAESDEDVAPEHYFSLPDDDPPPGTEPAGRAGDADADAPLEFRTAPGAASAPPGWSPAAGYGEGAAPGASYALPDYYAGGYYSEADPGPPPEMSGESTPTSFMDEEAFKRLQGKRNRGREEINFVEIKGDDQLSGVQQWLTKSLTEEQSMRSFSKKKGEQPTGQQRRKHQITYLIHQAKERELELKNSWAENKLSRRQTQAKYGF